MSSGLPMSLRAYIAVTAVAGGAWTAYLTTEVVWDLSTLGEATLLILLVVLAGSFPLPVAPRVKTDVTTAVLFSAALLLDPGMAALVGATGIVIYTLMQRVAWYKYPFNAGATALYVGLASAVFHELSASDSLLTVALVPSVAVMYLSNTALVTFAASLQTGVNPLRLWWEGTKENGPAELSLFSFGFLGAMAYGQSPWTVVALFIPIAIIYLAFSRLARANTELEEAMKKLEALQGEIANKAKLSSIGALFMDLSNQIKNPLSILLGRLENAQYRLEKGEPIRRDLSISMEAGWRIQELAESFSSMGHKRWVRLDIGALLNEAFGMAALQSGTIVETRWHCPADLPKVMGTAVLLRESLANIFSNAMEAVAEDGVVTASISRVDGVVAVSISDNGVGIPDQIKEHLFEPFHSSKPGGSGLGLFATKHILEMHQGSVEIESEVGKGTSVTLTLPAAMSENREGDIGARGISDVMFLAPSR